MRILPKSGDADARAAISPRWRATSPSARRMVALKIVLMAHHAWMMGDAIVRTLYRLFVSRQNLLEWRTASQAHKSGGNDLGSYYGMMYGAVIIGRRRPRHPGAGRFHRRLRRASSSRCSGSARRPSPG